MCVCVCGGGGGGGLRRPICVNYTAPLPQVSKTALWVEARPYLNFLAS